MKKVYRELQEISDKLQVIFSLMKARSYDICGSRKLECINENKDLIEHAYQNERQY